VRVTSPGAGATLPLRMVAAGTGATTPIALWILGEGRYEPQGVPTFRVTTDELVWDWGTNASNYASLVDTKFKASNGLAWLVDGGEPLSSWQLEQPLRELVATFPDSSGYGDGDPVKANDEVEADLAKLDGAIDKGALWYSRVQARLARAGLASDLVIGAAADQAQVVRTFFPTKTTGTPPCPSYPPCPGEGGAGQGGASASTGGASVGAGGAAASAGGAPAASSDDGGCAVREGDRDAGGLAAVGLALAAVAIARRRRR
jgi:hypothetical protein